MSFTPIIPVGGFLGFQFLERTATSQRAAYDASPRLERDVNYFRENISKVNSAEELVSDYRLLRVALGAFGLQDDIGSRFFIQKVLQDGTLDSDALSNRLTDSRYRDMSSAFGFDLGTPNTKLSTFAEDIIAQFKERSFEAAVGEVNDDMRLALNAQREMETLSQSTSSETTKWLSVLGNPPLRTVFETAFNLPSSFGALDLDRQLEELQDRSERFFGSREISQFSESGARDALVERYLTMRTISATTPAQTSANTALVLLGG